MEISQRIVVDRPVDEVWAFLTDVPAVVACIPGAELTGERGDGVYTGVFHVRIGPMTATLEGEGRLERDDAAKSGRLSGKGVDRAGGSRASVAMQYAVSAENGGSAIAVTADVTLTGRLGQVGRTGLVKDIAGQLTREFAANLEARLGAGDAPQHQEAPRPFDAGGAATRSLWTRLVAWVKRLLGR